MSTAGGDAPRRTGAGATSVRMRRPRWQPPKGPVWKWSAGILAAVLATVATGWLTRLGVVPGDDPAAPAPTVAESPVAAVPFTVAVRTAQDPCGSGWVVEKAPGQFAEPDLGPYEDWSRWLQEVKPVPAVVGNFGFTIQGRSAAQVTLTGMRARVLQRRPAVRGTHVYQICGDAGAFRSVTVDLDASPPRLTTSYRPEIAKAALDVPPQELRPIAFPYRVSISDAESFAVFGVTKHCDCTWRLELSWTSEGRSGTYVLDADGRPLRTSGIDNVVATCTKVINQRLSCTSRNP